MLFALAYILFVIFILCWFQSNKRREWAALKAIHDWEELNTGRVTAGGDVSEQRSPFENLIQDEAAPKHVRSRNDTARLETARNAVLQHELIGLHVGYIGDDLLLTGRGIHIQGADKRVLRSISQSRNLADFVRLMGDEHEP